MFSLICAWINDWENNCEAGDLRRHHAFYVVIVLGSIGLLGTYVSELWIGILSWKCKWKSRLPKWRPVCPRGRWVKNFLCKISANWFQPLHIKRNGNRIVEKCKLLFNCRNGLIKIFEAHIPGDDGSYRHGMFTDEPLKLWFVLIIYILYMFVCVHNKFPVNGFLLAVTRVLNICHKKHMV